MKIEKRVRKRHVLSPIRLMALEKGLPIEDFWHAGAVICLCRSLR